MAGVKGQHRVQTREGKAKKEKEKEYLKIAIVLAASAFSTLFFAFSSLWQESVELKHIFLFEVTGNVINPGIYALEDIQGEVSLPQAIEVAGGYVVEVLFNRDFKVCNGCSVYVPYPGEKVESIQMHAFLLNALGGKKCLQDAVPGELRLIPGVGPSRARVIYHYVSSGKYMRGEPWPKGIGPKTVALLNDYFEDCRDRK